MKNKICKWFSELWGIPITDENMKKVEKHLSYQVYQLIFWIVMLIIITMYVR